MAVPSVGRNSMHTLVGTIVDVGSKALGDTSPADAGAPARDAVEVRNCRRRESRPVIVGSTIESSVRDRSVDVGVAGFILAVITRFVSTATDNLGEFCRLVIV